MLYINEFVSTSSTNIWKDIFKFQIRFQIIDRKPKYIQMNSEALTLVKVQWLYINEFVSTSSIS